MLAYEERRGSHKADGKTLLNQSRVVFSRSSAVTWSDRVSQVFCGVIGAASQLGPVSLVDGRHLIRLKG